MDRADTPGEQIIDELLVMDSQAGREIKRLEIIIAELSEYVKNK